MANPFDSLSLHHAIPVRVDFSMPQEWMNRMGYFDPPAGPGVSIGQSMPSAFAPSNPPAPMSMPDLVAGRGPFFRDAQALDVFDSDSPYEMIYRDG